MHFSVTEAELLDCCRCIRPCPTAGADDRRTGIDPLLDIRCMYSRIDSVCIDPTLYVVWISYITIRDDPGTRRKQPAQVLDFSFDPSRSDAVDADEAGFTELGYDVSDLVSAHDDSWFICLLHAEADAPSSWSKLLCGLSGCQGFERCRNRFDQDHVNACLYQMADDLPVLFQARFKVRCEFWHVTVL